MHAFCMRLADCKLWNHLNAISIWFSKNGMAFYQSKYHQIKHIGGERHIFKQSSDIEQTNQGNDWKLIIFVSFKHILVKVVLRVFSFYN